MLCCFGGATLLILLEMAGDAAVMEGSTASGIKVRFEHRDDTDFVSYRVYVGEVDRGVITWLCGPCVGVYGHTAFRWPIPHSRRCGIFARKKTTTMRQSLAWRHFNGPL